MSARRCCRSRRWSTSTSRAPLAGNDKLRIGLETPEAKDRAQTIHGVLRALGTPNEAVAVA